MASADQNPRRAGAIWTLALDRPPPAIIPQVEAVFCRTGVEMLPALIQAMDASSAGEIQTRFDTGRRCYSAWVEGNLAAYGWVSFDEEWIGELRLRLRLLRGEAYIWDCATLPAYRQKLLYSALLGFIIHELAAQGLRRAWIGADLDNVASQRGIARAGFQHVADLVIERVFAVRMAWVQGLPGVPEPLVNEARRVFLDNRARIWLDALVHP
jgi:hypothetical protein